MGVKVEVGQAAASRGAAGPESPDKERSPLLSWECSGIGGVQGPGIAAFQPFWHKRILRYQVSTNLWTCSALPWGDESLAGLSEGGNSNQLMESHGFHGQMEYSGFGGSHKALLLPFEIHSSPGELCHTPSFSALTSPARTCCRSCPSEPEQRQPREEQGVLPVPPRTERIPK